MNNRFETTIVDIVFSPTITESMLLYFSEFYEEHLNQFKHGLNQSLPIKQKQHFSIDSFPFSCSNGPPTYNSCFKYELRNAIFKKGAYNICNFKIIATSLAISNELSALSHSVNKSRSRDFCLKTHKIHHLSTLNGSQKVKDKLFLNKNDTILCSVKAKILGRQYSKRNFFAIRQRPVDKMICLGRYGE